MIGRALFLPGGLSCAPQKIPNLRRGRLRTSPVSLLVGGDAHIAPLGSRNFAGDFRKSGAICRADVGIGPYERLVNGRLQIGVLKAANADRKAVDGQEYEGEKASEEHRQLAQLVGRFIAVAHVLQVGQHVLQRL